MMACDYECFAVWKAALFIFWFIENYSTNIFYIYFESYYDKLQMGLYLF